MAPRPAPTKNREAFLHKVGEVGRRTGLTLKEGVRDEHGLEAIDGFFSSPDKSPTKPNGFGAGSNTLTSEDMQESTIPEPAAVMTSRRSILPPPRSRSPMKTSLFGSPRRTPGIRSSPMRQADSTPIRPSTNANNTVRTLDFSTSQPQFSARQQSALREMRASSTPPKVNGAKEKATQRENEEKFDDQAPDFSDSDLEEDTNMAGVEEYDEPTEDVSDDNFQVDGGDDTIGGEAEQDEAGEEQAPENGHELEETAEEELQQVPGGRRGRKATQDAAAETSARAAGANNSTKRKNPTDEPVETDGAQPSKKRRGRPPKVAAAAAVYSDPPQDDEAPVSAKIAKPKRGPRKPTTNGRTAVPVDPEVDKVVSKYVSKGGMHKKNRSLYILRKESPMEDGVVHTKSGRISVRPLAYWRNERCVFGDGEADLGERFPLTSIKEIVRVDEMEETRPKKVKRGGAPKKSKARRVEEESEEEETGQAEPWETDPGILYGQVKGWDNDYQGIIDEETEIDIAYAPAGIETREVQGSTFRYAKLVSLPFFGSGVVDLPPGGIKRPKNSRKMQMMFFVFQGRVDVKVGDTRFSVGKGGIWQVPRGNQYSISNPNQHPARVFFSQGCKPVVMGGVREEEMMGSQALPQEHEPPRAKSKGPSKDKKSMSKNDVQADEKPDEGGAPPAEVAMEKPKAKRGRKPKTAAAE